MNQKYQKKTSIALARPAPPGAGVVMWCASQVAPYPASSPETKSRRGEKESVDCNYMTATQSVDCN